MAKGWAGWEAKGRLDTIADKTQTVHKPSADDVKAWRTAAAPLHEEWVKGMKRTGLNTDDLYADLIKTLKKYDSLYE